MPPTNCASMTFTPMRPASAGPGWATTSMPGTLWVTIQTVASRAWQAVRQYQLGVRGRPRFKGKGQFVSVEGKTLKQGLRWHSGELVWGTRRVRAHIPSDDPVVAHALGCPIKYVRLVRRKLNDKTRWFVQLICAGKP